MAPDSTVKKVRCKDPDTGTVEEFVRTLRTCLEEMWKCHGRGK